MAGGDRQSRQRVPERVVILGAGGHAREVLDVFDAINAMEPSQSYDVLGFVSEVEDEWRGMRNGKPVLGGFDWFGASADRASVKVICGVGSPAVRRRMVDRCKALGLGFARAVHPRAEVNRWAEIGEGVLVAAGVVITNQTTIGDHVHLNLQVTVSHDTKIEDFCTVAPGVHIAGAVHVGEGCDFGTGSSVIPQIEIGAWSVIGAGAVVTDALPPNSTAVGVPAQVIKERPDGWWREV